MEQGALGVAPLQHNNDNHHVDAALLPTHLKYGMLASLALATLFVAGAKYTFVTEVFTMVLLLSKTKYLISVTGFRTRIAHI